MPTKRPRSRTLKRAYLALFLALLPCVAPRIRRPVPHLEPIDFYVYYAGAVLVSQGHADRLYTGADTGRDPQKVVALPGTPIERAARSRGILGVAYYVYPPLLADLLLPLTPFGIAAAQKLWLALDLLLLLGTALCLTSLLEIPILSAASALVALSLLCFAPVIHCLAYGQVMILLLFLWTLGLTLHHKGRYAWSGAVFGLASAIKLTPAIVLLPFLVWRNWRWITSFAASLLGFGAICLLFDGPHPTAVFFSRVMPAMSNAIPDFLNFSLSAATERLVMILRDGPAQPLLGWLPASCQPSFASLPASTFLAGKLVTVLLFIPVAFAIIRPGARISRSDKLTILALLGLISAVFSPVSWFNAYTLAFLAFVVLWREALTGPVPTLYLAALTLTSILLGSAITTNLMIVLIRSNHIVPAAILQLAPLLLATALTLYRLAQIKPEQPLAADPGFAS